MPTYRYNNHYIRNSTPPLPSHRSFVPPLLTPSNREDSSIEPTAFHPTRWPTSNAISHSLPPVQLSPGLSPTLRSALPQPKPVRPPSAPAHSDLSAASTRAEQEPPALRDLRRVTAPPSLMDPWQYDKRPSQMTKPRFVKSVSATSLVTDRLSEVRGPKRERWSVLSDGGREKPRRTREWFAHLVGARERLDNRQPNFIYEAQHPLNRFTEQKTGLRGMGQGDTLPVRHHRQGLFQARNDAIHPPVPDRFHDAPLTVHPVQGISKDTADSVLSAVTVEEEDGPRVRPRATSEGALIRRPSFRLKQSTQMLWDKLFRRAPKRSGGRAPDREGSPERRRSGKLSRFRSADSKARPPVGRV